jgi:hypothetical protein
MFFVSVVAAEQGIIQGQNHPPDQGNIHIEMFRMWDIHKKTNQ